MRRSLLERASSNPNTRDRGQEGRGQEQITITQESGVMECRGWGPQIPQTTYQRTKYHDTHTPTTSGHREKRNFWVKTQKSDKVKASEQTNIPKESSRQTLEEEFVPSLGFYCCGKIMNESNLWRKVFV